LADDGLPHRPPDKLQVAHAAEGEMPADGRKDAGPSAAEIEAAMAGTIRADGAERAAMTLAETLFAQVPGPQRGNITAMLEEMAADSRYADIKAVTTASGQVFFFSKRHLREDEAFRRSRVEEGMWRIAERVRADSRERAALTAQSDLHAVSEETTAEKIDAVIAGMRTDPRYADIRQVTAADGRAFLHSDRHISGGYASILCRALSPDRCAALAETVREDSRVYPRATNVRIFEQPVFGLEAGALDSAVEEILRRAEFEDIKRLVHPATGGVYLFSDRYLTEPHAFALMDWEEVGKENSP